RCSGRCGRRCGRCGQRGREQPGDHGSLLQGMAAKASVRRCGAAGSPVRGLPRRVSSVQRLQAQDRRQHHREHGHLAALVAVAVAVAAAVAVLVAALETLAEVVGVLVVGDVAAVVAVAGVDVAVAAAVVVAPAVLAVGATGAQAFAVAVAHGLAHQVGTVAVGLVPAAAVGIAVAGGGVVERIARVVAGCGAPALLLGAQACVVVALVAVLGHAPLLLQGMGALGAAPLGVALPALAVVAELFGALAVGADARLLAIAVDAV